MEERFADYAYVGFDEIPDEAGPDLVATLAHLKSMVAAIRETWQEAVLLGSEPQFLAMRIEDLIILRHICKVPQDREVLLQGVPVVAITPGQSLTDGSLLVLRAEDEGFARFMGLDIGGLEVLALLPGNTMLSVDWDGDSDVPFCD